MEISVNEDYQFILREVHNPLILENASGETIVISMRDVGFELVYDGEIYNFAPKSSNPNIVNNEDIPELL